jgi:predicted Zn-dependent peptidase
VLLDALIKLTVELVSDEELSRAKNMLKSMMFMQLESRLISCEDIAKQVMIYGHRKSAKSLCDEIDAVTASDLKQLVRKMLENNPSVSIIGYDVSVAPSYDAIVAFTNSYKSEILKRSTMSFH